MANLLISQEAMDGVINFLAALPWKQANGILQTLIGDLNKQNAVQTPAPVEPAPEPTPEVAPEAPAEPTLEPASEEVAA